MCEDKIIGCNNPDCGISGGICGEMTFGSGDLSDNGYWEKPCYICAAAWKKLYPKDKVWPNTICIPVLVYAGPITDEFIPKELNMGED
jgi:hypothetical protein